MSKNMVSFETDYNNGAVPEILNRLVSTNDDKTTGYGFDEYCVSAKAKIREACGMPYAEVYFLIGGSQTNSTVIDALTLGCEGAIAPKTGHINVHESGAVEAFGHKVLVIPSDGSKLTASGINEYMTAFLADDTFEHMVQPKVVYLTFPTEYGAIYSRKELEDIYSVCKKLSAVPRLPLRCFLHWRHEGRGYVRRGSRLHE